MCAKIKILIVEDDGYRVTFFIERFGKNDLKITENSTTAIEYLKDCVFDYIFLDNDLGKGNGEGLDVVTFLKDHPKNKNNRSIMIIHSWNIIASARMKALLPYAVLAPFNTEKFYDLDLDI